MDLRMQIPNGVDLSLGISQIIKVQVEELVAAGEIPANLEQLVIEGLVMDAKFKNMEIQYLISDGVILGAQFISYWDVNGEPTKCFVLPAEAEASMSKQLDIELEIGCVADDGAANMCLDDCLNPSCEAFCVCEAICANPLVNGYVSDGECAIGEVEVPLVTEESDCKCCLVPTCEMICASDEVGGALPVEGECDEGLGLAPIPGTECTCCVPCQAICGSDEVQGSVPDGLSCEEGTGFVPDLQGTGCDCCVPCPLYCLGAGGQLPDGMTCEEGYVYLDALPGTTCPCCVPLTCELICGEAGGTVLEEECGIGFTPIAIPDTPCVCCLPTR
jgi:hypothetical protein